MMSNAEARWNECLEHIRADLPSQEFKTWFEPLSFHNEKENRITINVPNKYVGDYIGKTYRDVVTQALHRVFGDTVQLIWRNLELVESMERESEERSRMAEKEAAQKPALDSRLNSCYTFANFVEGESNKLARNVALAIANAPGQTTFNPFFLYGPSGVGKTHLVNAIGIQLKELYPEKRVLFVSAHEFKTQYTESVVRNTQHDFINFYQSVEMLIIDDIQEITTAKTQMAFFHIFNHLQRNRRQLIITCDRPPVLFEGIEDRMLTRFKWGMIAEMEKPGTKLRKDILVSKIRRDNLPFPEEVVQYIAQNVESSVRELEGIINSLMAYSVIDNCDIDLKLTARVVARAVNLERRELTAENISATVAQHYGLKARELASKSRKQNIVQARQIAMYLCHKYTEMSYSQIGRQFGGRDHSTVLHSCNQVARRMSIDKSYRHEVEELEAALKK